MGYTVLMRQMGGAGGRGEIGKWRWGVGVGPTEEEVFFVGHPAEGGR